MCVAIKGHMNDVFLLLNLRKLVLPKTASGHFFGRNCKCSLDNSKRGGRSLVTGTLNTKYRIMNMNLLE